MQPVAHLAATEHTLAPAIEVMAADTKTIPEPDTAA